MPVIHTFMKGSSSQFQFVVDFSLFHFFFTVSQLCDTQHRQEMQSCLLNSIVTTTTIATAY